jgi:hypothetical protein
LKLVFTHTNRDGSLVASLTAAEDRSFADIAFNDIGNLLFAWAYGRHKDLLYIWRCDTKLAIAEVREAALPYEVSNDNCSQEPN